MLKMRQRFGIGLMILGASGVPMNANGSFPQSVAIISLIAGFVLWVAQ